MSKNTVSSEGELRGLLMENLPTLFKPHGREVMMIGEDVGVTNSPRIGLLGIDENGDLHLFELKLNEAPTSAITQLLEINEMFKSVRRAGLEDWVINRGRDLESEFLTHFERPLPAEINRHRFLTVIAESFDPGYESVLPHIDVPIELLEYPYWREKWNSNPSQLRKKTQLHTMLIDDQSYIYLPPATPEDQIRPFWEVYSINCPPIIRLSTIYRDFCTTFHARATPPKSATPSLLTFGRELKRIVAESSTWERVYIDAASAEKLGAKELTGIATSPTETSTHTIVAFVKVE